MFILLRSARPNKNRPKCGPAEPLRRPLATFGGFGPVLTRTKIMVLFRLERCFHLLRHNSTTIGRICQALFRPGLLRLRRPAAVSCLSAMAYSKVTSTPP